VSAPRERRGEGIDEKKIGEDLGGEEVGELLARDRGTELDCERLTHWVTLPFPK